MRKVYNVGEKYNHLLILSFEKNYYLCQCDCGVKKTIRKDYIGTQISCGCMRRQKDSNYFVKTSAKAIWRRRYKEMKFEDFYKTSQLPCFYCGVEPSNSYNYAKIDKKSSLYAKENSDFIYNGLDRLNNNLPHLINNVVPCCWICNRSKRERTVIDFINYIKNLKYNFNKFEFKLLDMPNNRFIERAYHSYKASKIGIDISMREFYSFSQMKCYYCGAIACNCIGNFKYNGIDRIDSSKGHEINNIVPCCKYCNFTKGNMSLEAFREWIVKIKNSDFMRERLTAEQL